MPPEVRFFHGRLSRSEVVDSRNYRRAGQCSVTLSPLLWRSGFYASDFWVLCIKTPSSVPYIRKLCVGKLMAFCA